MERHNNELPPNTYESYRAKLQETHLSDNDVTVQIVNADVLPKIIRGVLAFREPLVQPDPAASCRTAQQLAGNNLNVVVVDEPPRLATGRVVRPAVAPVSEPVSETVTEPATAPVTAPVTEPVSEPVTEPATTPVTEPATAPVTEATNENSNGKANVNGISDDQSEGDANDSPNGSTGNSDAAPANPGGESTGIFKQIVQKVGQAINNLRKSLSPAAASA